MSRYSFKNFLSQSTEIFVGNISLIHFFQVSEKIMPMRGFSRFCVGNFYGKEGEEGRNVTIFCQTFLSHSTEKLRRETYLVFT